MKNNDLLKISYDFSVAEKLNWPDNKRNKLAEISMREFFIGQQETYKKAFFRMNDIFH